MDLLTPKPTSLQNVLAGTLGEGGTRLVVPVFQRPYEWTDANIDSFVDKLNQAAKDDDPFYFMNNIILLEDGGERHIIDGQQRLVSYFLMLCAYNHLLLERFEEEARLFCEIVRGQQGNDWSLKEWLKAEDLQSNFFSQGDSNKSSPQW